MAYYDALIVKWSTLNPGTTQQKLDQINSLTVSAPIAGKVIVSREDILAAIVPAELAALSGLQMQQLTFVCGSDKIDISSTSLARAVLQLIFGSGTTTRNNLIALNNSSSSPSIPWWRATVSQGGGELRDKVALSDLVAAGGLT